MKIVGWLTIFGMMEVDWTYDELNNDGNKHIDYLNYNIYVLLVYILESVQFGRSLTYERKSIELKLEHCGTPIETGRGLVKLFPSLTIWV